jgi:hypothetical protein
MQSCLITKMDSNHFLVKPNKTLIKTLNLIWEVYKESSRIT